MKHPAPHRAAGHNALWSSLPLAGGATTPSHICCSVERMGKSLKRRISFSLFWIIVSCSDCYCFCYSSFVVAAAVVVAAVIVVVVLSCLQFYFLHVKSLISSSLRVPASWIPRQPFWWCLDPIVTWPRLPTSGKHRKHLSHGPSVLSGSCPAWPCLTSDVTAVQSDFCGKGAVNECPCKETRCIKYYTPKPYSSLFLHLHITLGGCCNPTLPPNDWICANISGRTPSWKSKNCFDYHIVGTIVGQATKTVSLSLSPSLPPSLCHLFFLPCLSLSCFLNQSSIYIYFVLQRSSTTKIRILASKTWKILEVRLSPASKSDIWHWAKRFLNTFWWIRITRKSPLRLGLEASQLPNFNPFRVAISHRPRWGELLQWEPRSLSFPATAKTSDVKARGKLNVWERVSAVSPASASESGVWGCGVCLCLFLV